MKNTCQHNWAPNKDSKIDNLVCPDCGAVAFKQKDKDPFSETEGSAIQLIKPAKATWDGMNIRARSKWYQERRELITADIQKIGTHFARLKWDVPIGTWSRMKRFVKQEVSKPTSHAKLSNTYSDDEPQIAELPKLPAWSDEWSEAVQLQWLKNYKALAITRALGA